MTDEERQTPDTPDTEAPYSPPASGGDPDSRKRALKTALAGAEASGDTDAADDIREQLDELNEEMQPTARQTAAERRRAAAQTGAKTTAAPQGRVTPAKATTAADPKSKS